MKFLSSKYLKTPTLKKKKGKWPVLLNYFDFIVNNYSTYTAEPILVLSRYTASKEELRNKLNHPLLYALCILWLVASVDCIWKLLIEHIWRQHFNNYH